MRCSRSFSPATPRRRSTAASGSQKLRASGNRAPSHGARLARRCPGRAKEQTCLSSASERGRQRLTSASLSERSEQYARSERRRSFLCERRRRRRTPDVRAADLQEETAEQRFSVPPAPTKTAGNLANIAASGASNQQSAMREQLSKKGAGLHHQHAAQHGARSRACAWPG